MNWLDTYEYGYIVCDVSPIMRLRLEPQWNKDGAEDKRYHVAVFAGRNGFAFYRSRKSWPIEEAKAEAILQGIIAANRLSRMYASIAQSLSFTAPGDAK